MFFVPLVFIFLLGAARIFFVLYIVGHCSLSVSYIKDDDNDEQ